MSRVSLSYGLDIIKTLEESINKLGGMGQFVQKNSFVFIKPDLTLPLGPPISIQPRILGYIVKSCRTFGASKVYIGFNPFDGISSKQLVKLLGLDHYLQICGGTLLNLETESYSKVPISNPLEFETIQVPDKLLQSDVFISIIAPRTDIFGNLALGVSNYLGLLTDEQKQQLFKTGSSIGLLDFYKISPPQLAIWDAQFVGTGQGPFDQKALPYNLILASDDLIAGESVMTYLMGIEPSQNQILKMVTTNQLGVVKIDQILLIGEKIPDHRKSIQKPETSLKNISEWIDVIEGESCAGCRICLRYFLDFLLQFIKKDLKEFGGLTWFIGKLSNDLPYSLKTGVILFGNCAISSNLSLKFNSKTQKKKYFFKFSGCPPLNLRSIEKFSLDFKEWLPSLEIIEEFIRKWTIGRQFRSHQNSLEVKK